MGEVPKPPVGATQVGGLSTDTSPPGLSMGGRLQVGLVTQEAMSHLPTTLP